ncbi:MAG TPA: LPS export ABC transporter periplasmic protein LptC [Candidatus Binatia bacterium]|jgi:LPS export ABC transporter protein LptC
MNTRRIRTILLIAISACLGVVTYKVGESVWKGKAGKQVLKEALKYAPDAALQIKDFHRAQVEDGRKTWEVFGTEARYLKPEGQLVLNKPRIFFYQKDDTTVEATGNEGRLWLDDEQEMQKAQLLGEVQVNFRGYVLNTGEILYFKSKNHMVLPGRVTVKGEGMEMDGGQMEVNLDDDKIRVSNNVKTRMEPDKLDKMGKKKGKSDAKKEG